MFLAHPIFWIIEENKPDTVRKRVKHQTGREWQEGKREQEWLPEQMTIWCTGLTLNSLLYGEFKNRLNEKSGLALWKTMRKYLLRAFKKCVLLNPLSNSFTKIFKISEKNSIWTIKFLMRKYFTKVVFLKNHYSPGWRGSVDWALDCEPKGHRFDSQPGLQARPPGGGMWEATIHWCFSLSPSL